MYIDKKELFETFQLKLFSSQFYTRERMEECFPNFKRRILIYEIHKIQKVQVLQFFPAF